jgi:hypothetical protein
MRRKKQQPVESVGIWGQLAQGRDVETAARGTVIYAPEQPARELLLLRSGQVALYLLSPESRPLTLRVLEPGQIFGHVVIGDGGSYDTFAEALTPVRFSWRSSRCRRGWRRCCSTWPSLRAAPRLPGYRGAATANSPR